LEEGDPSSTLDVRFDDIFDDEFERPSRVRNRYHSGSGSESGGDQLGYGSEFVGTKSRSSDEVDIED